MLIRITAPHFCAGIDYPVRYAPILDWMRKRKWLVDDIIKYCYDKGWKVEIVTTQ